MQNPIIMFPIIGFCTSRNICKNEKVNRCPTIYYCQRRLNIAMIKIKVPKVLFASFNFPHLFLVQSCNLLAIVAG